MGAYIGGIRSRAAGVRAFHDSLYCLGDPVDWVYRHGKGIGAALAQAHRAVEGDISGVTQNLGVAFNSTFIALLLSIVLMFLVHQLQLLQERLVFETESYTDDHLIRHLQSG